MYEKLDVCRVCLATDVRMATIAGTPLQLVYEKLTNNLLQSDSLPDIACYMCCARLGKSQALMETATRATRALTNLLKSNKITKAAVTKINRHTVCGTLAVSKTKYVDVDIDATVHPDVNATVPLIDVKPALQAIDVAATVPMEIEVEPILLNDVKVEIKEEPLDYDETSCSLDMVNKDDEDSGADDDDEDIPLKSLGEQQRKVTVIKEEIKGDIDPAHTSDAEKRKPPSKPRKCTKGKTGAAQSKPANQKSSAYSITNTDDSLVCHVCQRQLNRASNMIRHLKSHNVNPYECRVCKAQFMHLAGLEDHHVKIHTDTKLYTCDVCNHQFDYQRYLRAHERRHTGVRRHECRFCKRRFYESSILRNHLLIHTGEKPHGCKFCNKRYNSATTLKRHIIISHTNDKRFECDYCHYRFVAKNRLEIHLRRHTGERPFSCNVCDRTFIERSVLTKHLATHNDKS